jgi:hypothetical protein
MHFKRKRIYTTRICASDVGANGHVPGGADGMVPCLLTCFDEPTVWGAGLRESVLFISTQFSNLYTAVDTPARAA